MGRKITFKIADKGFQAEIIKVDRDKVYGYVEDHVTDRNGKPCTTGNLLEDGQTVAISGSTALKTVDPSLKEVDKKTLKTVYMNGKDAVLVPSVYDDDVLLNEVSSDRLFDLEVSTVYQLNFDTPEQRADAIKYIGDRYFHFIFNYRADYEGADAILLTSETDIFALTGRLLEFEYLENTMILNFQGSDEPNPDEEEIDFGML
ncbi:MAG: hypothetical protein LW688_04280 [Cryomorphaceae bacterium]|jgi:hypothetical protein|nr:hypothetical protein [Cryomorphaceae bacterium]